MQRNRSFSIPSLLLLLLPLLVLIAMAEEKTATTTTTTTTPSQPAAVHIIYTESSQDEQPEAYHIRTLASVLGSEEAAKEALVYSYKTAASGFSAKLTPEQVEEISKQPGVLQVVPSTTYQLHSGPVKLN